MAIRRRAAGKLVIEQARERAPVRALLEVAEMPTDGLDWPPACYLVVWFGDVAVGAVGIETRIDAALMRSLVVAAPMRRRRIGAELIAAARKAAHTRGARTLWALGGGAGEYLRRFGFEPAPIAVLLEAMRGAPLAEYYRARPDAVARESAWRVDISRDGVIER